MPFLHSIGVCGMLYLCTLHLDMGCVVSPCSRSASESESSRPAPLLLGNSAIQVEKRARY